MKRFSLAASSTLCGRAYALLSTVTLCACAATLPPKARLDARAAYSEANSGSTRTLNPADVHEAKLQLDVAEAAFAKDAESQDVKDQSYLALRKSELAVVIANTRRLSAMSDDVVAAMHADERKALAGTAAELEQTQDALAAKDVALDAEAARRKLAEERAANAAAALARIGSVKNEARGMVITLSGEVLFQSGKSELLPAAQAKLAEVATALTQENPTSNIVVEGHTDSQGSPDFNLALSRRRAEAVAAYLVTSGVAKDRIASQGIGEARPIADNQSPEGRANNRRVELIVTPATGS